MKHLLISTPILYAPILYAPSFYAASFYAASFYTAMLCAAFVSAVTLCPARVSASQPANSFSDTSIPALLEEVFVSASRSPTQVRQIGSSVTIVNREEISLAAYPSLTEVLRAQVGISATNNGGQGKATSLRIRGEEGYRTLVMIDGVQASDPSGTQVGPQIQHLNASDDIERIEILRGPQGFAYGADAGGVVHIFTRELKQGKAAQISAQGGAFGSRQINGFIAAGGAAGNVFISAAHNETEGFNARADDNSGENDGYENRTLHFKAGKQLNKLRLQLVLRDIRADNEFDNCFSQTSSNDCLGEFAQRTARAGLSYQAKRSYHNAGFSQTQVERNNFTAGTQSFFAKGDIQNLDYSGSFQLSQAFTLVTGGDLKTETIESQSSNRPQRDQLGLFSELQMRARENTYLNSGFRYDNNDDFGEHLSLRLSAAHIIPLQANTLKLRGSIGSGFRAPSLSEIAYNNRAEVFGPAAETELEEEKSQGLDVGLDFFAANGSSVELNYFYQKIKQEIFFDLRNFSGYLQGAGDSLSQGIELGLSYPVYSFLEFRGNATYNDTESSSGAQRIRRPEKVANVGFNLSLMDGNLNLRSNFRIVRASVNEIFGEGQVTLDDYEVLDLSANYRLGAAVQIFARVDNLLNENYREITDYNTAGIATYAGIRIEI
ncbi:MAG: TonB-dependent receptor [Cellvibrionaceae bacterium]|nr:TonB-dependent receptor [Cellvibrionaceae bacterium]